MTGEYSEQFVRIDSDVPAWGAHPAQRQQLRLKVGQWGDSSAPAARTYVMVHGITGNLHWWDVFAHALLAASTEPLRLIAYDLRGRGDSDKPDAPYHVVAHAADCAALLDAIGITEPVAFVGHSLGGHIGTAFASRYPQRCRALVLVDGGGRLAADVAQAIAPAVRRVGQFYPDYAAYVAPLKAAGIIPDWSAAVDRVYSYDCVAVAGGVMSKVSKPALMQELDNLDSYYAEADSYYPRIVAPTVVLRAPTAVSAGLSPFLTDEVLATMRATIGGGTTIVDAPGKNHYTIMLEPTTAMIAAALA